MLPPPPAPTESAKNGSNPFNTDVNAESIPPAPTVVPNADEPPNPPKPGVGGPNEPRLASPLAPTPLPPALEVGGMPDDKPLFEELWSKKLVAVPGDRDAGLPLTPPYPALVGLAVRF